ncbi:MAG TPA: alpha/beta fold hydrolase [Flavisolibacter sp.]|jgi:hypothetical protein|nr:alpha/beta fold hydrolase [Flavisolibacter sp.]
MKKQIPFSLILLLFTMCSFAMAQDSSLTESAVVLHTNTGDLFGTLTIPDGGKNIPVALLIAGSGPTDRNGNNPMAPNDGLRKLSYSLAHENIASLRFDKRGIGESKGSMKSEASLRFDNYVSDAVDWIRLLKKDKRFSKVIVIGHSEGSLIGMIAAKGLADQFISIAGAGKSADKILKEQLNSQTKIIKEASYLIIDSLAAGYTVKNVNIMLYNLFRPSVQPYMISWFHYNPAAELKKLAIPVLIVQGNNDLQVSTEDARALAAALPKSRLMIIEGMNHIFRIVGDRKENLESYTKPELPLAPELVKAIVSFIKGKS